MNRINFTVLLAWLACVLVVAATTAGATARQAAGPPQPTSATTPPRPTTVKGTVTYGELAALTANAVVTVQLVDISAADAPAVVLGEQIIDPAGRPVPFEFEIRYDPASIKPDGEYVVGANGTVDGKLVLQTTKGLGVITQGQPTMVEVVLAKVGPWSSSDLGLSSGCLARFSH